MPQLRVGQDVHFYKWEPHSGLDGKGRHRGPLAAKVVSHPAWAGLEECVNLACWDEGGHPFSRHGVPVGQRDGEDYCKALDISSVFS